LEQRRSDSKDGRSVRTSVASTTNDIRTYHAKHPKGHNKRKHSRSPSSDKLKTIRNSLAADPKTFRLQHNVPPDTRSNRTLADAYLGHALRLMNNFENRRGLLIGNAIPPELVHAEIGGGRGAEFAKFLDELLPFREQKKKNKSTIQVQQSHPSTSFSTSRGRGLGGNNNNQRSGTFWDRIQDFIYDSYELWLEVMEDAEADMETMKNAAKTTKNNNANDHTQNDKETSSSSIAPHEKFHVEKEALYYLQKSSEMGNRDAQNMLANTLASGILPVTNHPNLRSVLMNSKNITSIKSKQLLLTTDFAEGGEQLARAIMLWHLSAMDGNIEAAMALGYRHRFSAMVGKSTFTDFYYSNLVSEDSMAQFSATPSSYDESVQSTMSSKKSNPITATVATVILDKKGKKIKDVKVPTSTPPPPTHLVHSSSPNDHYGVLGTCDSALLYYEAAANAIMDELESSPLRAKTSPSQDNHILPEIHLRGTTSNLHDFNKPDELEEALQYFRIRASRKNPTPDIDAAYNLASYYHYGLKGVRQDMKLALKYYEIAADHGSAEAAGQAGKFHLWGMGVDEDERDLMKAYNYFRQGTPGGLNGCQRKFREFLNAKGNKPSKKKKKKGTKKSLNKRKKSNEKSLNGNDEEDDKDEDDDMLTWEDYMTDNELCEHPAVNGMGLLYAFGIPMVISVDIEMAKKWFDLARQMGNMDASYNLGMLTLGWLNPVANQGVYDFTDDDDDDIIKLNDQFDSIMEGADEISLGIIKELEKNPISGMSRDALLTIGEEVKEAVSNARLNQEENIRVKEYSRSKYVSKNGLSKSDYSDALSHFRRASKMGHIQAKHRLAMLYARGITFEYQSKDSTKTIVAVEKSCPKALSLYKDIADAGTTMSKRIRTAYKQYTIGEYESSLRNYMAAAETGSVVAQVNAAFLLEKGHCLGMFKKDCMKASVRYWRAAARQGGEIIARANKKESEKTAAMMGSEEASLRVGDFYYYGRLEESMNENDNDTNINSDIWIREHDFMKSPHPWIRYILFPEDLLPILRRRAIDGIRYLISHTGKGQRGNNTESYTKTSSNFTCSFNTHDESKTASESCQLPDNSEKETSGAKQCMIAEHRESEQATRELNSHLIIAAKYYNLAAKEHQSARANFNLGFMHEWGLGLSQDFPLAKRHYDLAAASPSGEGEIAAQIALSCMMMHEKFVKFSLALREWWHQKVESNSNSIVVLCIDNLLTFRHNSCRKVPKCEKINEIGNKILDLKIYITSFLFLVYLLRLKSRRVNIIRTTVA